MKTSIISIIKKILIILGWLLVWQIIAVVVGNRILLCGPLETMLRLAEDLMKLDFWISIMNSLGRIGLGLLGGIVVGIILGMLSYKFTIVEDILKWPMSYFKAAPVAAFVVLFLIWWSSEVLSTAICFLVVLPQIYVAFLTGLKSTDRKLLIMAKVHEVRPIDRFLFIYRPSLMPHLMTSFNISVAMAIKSGVAAEVIGVPKNSIGEGLYMAKVTLDTPGVLSMTVAIIVLSILAEKLILKLLDVFERADFSGHGIQAPVKNPYIKGENIFFNYEGNSVLRDMSFEYRANQKIVLNSPSGSGKTTLLNLLAGVLEPESGKIVKENVSCAYCFQEDRLCESVDAITNIAMVCGKDKAESYLEGILEKSYRNRPVSKLSGGQKRRIAVARAVSKEAGLLLLDEPYNGLDEDNIILIRDYIRKHSEGKIVVIASHIDAESL